MISKIDFDISILPFMISRPSFALKKPELEVLVAGGHLQPVKHWEEHVGSRAHHLFKLYTNCMKVYFQKTGFQYQGVGKDQGYILRA